MKGNTFEPLSPCKLESHNILFANTTKPILCVSIPDKHFENNLSAANQINPYKVESHMNGALISDS